MNIKIKYLNYILCIWLLLPGLSCQKNDKKQTKQLPKIEVVRLDSLLNSQTNVPAITNLLLAHHQGSFTYFGIDSSTAATFAQQYLQICSNPGFQDFYKQSKATIKTDSLLQAMQEAFAGIRAIDSSFKIPTVYLAFTGFTGSDMLLTNNSLVIGTDYFAGRKASYRPQLYDYQLYKYELPFVVPQLVSRIAQRYASNTIIDKTLLADMLYYGKCFAFAKKVLPTVADSLLLTIPAAQIEKTNQEAALVWAHFVENKLLYNSSDFVKAKYLEERPNTAEISTDCPGMVGRWLGLKIVASYIKSQKTENILALMAEPDAKKIFNNSNFRVE
jgi:hypothetical protein